MPPAAIAVPVATFLGAGTITATTAVIGAAVAGAVYGAVIGAATSLITGGNVLKGAMMGAAVGGITGGVLQGFGAADFVSTAATETSAAVGATTPSAGNIAAAQTAGVGTTANAATGAGGALLRSSGIPEGAKSVSEMAGKEVAKKGFFQSMTPGQGNLLGGAVQGLGKGAGAIFEANAAEDLAKETRKLEIDRFNRNVPGAAPGTTMRVTSLPERWASLTDMSTALNRYKEPLNQNQGLLNTRTV